MDYSGASCLPVLLCFAVTRCLLHNSIWRITECEYCIFNTKFIVLSLISPPSLAFFLSYSYSWRMAWPDTRFSYYTSWRPFQCPPFFFYLTISYWSSSIICTAQHTAFLWYCHLHTFPAIWQDDSFFHICIHAVFYIKMFSEQATISKLIYNVNFSLRSYFLARHLDFGPSASLLSDITASHICSALLEEINGRQTGSVSDALDSQEVP